MPSEVDICNLMLARLGDDATVSELDPPEGSAQAEHCATFYPIARDSLLEMHNWNFATRRKALTLTTTPAGAGYRLAYLLPAECIQMFAVIPPDVSNDYTVPFGDSNLLDAYGFSLGYFTSGSSYVTKDFALETNEAGELILLTDQEQAIGRYIIRVADTNKFSPLFVDTLSWYGASMLAGPVLKGDVGSAESKRCLQLAMSFLGKAATSDTRQQQQTPKQNVPWIGGR